ncbi:MAG: nucleotide exchange factor GrpE, partial [Planctomycetota bacterium]
YEAAAAERDELKEKLLRAQAETENVRKRSAREQLEGRKYAAVPLAKALLPGLDDLRRAVNAAKASRDAGADAERLAEDLVGGVAAVLQSLEKALAEQGITPIPAVGEPFDPNRHEALAQAPSAEYEPGVVMQEAQRGYAAGDRVVRPSHVIVAAAPAE